jgi:phospholipid-binding lipoprotein MlaA
VSARSFPALLLASLAGAVLIGGCAANRARVDHDPIEGVNRGIFWFNDKADVYVLEPLAKGWDKVLPDSVQRAIARFYRNLGTPVNSLNNLLQGKGKAAASDLGRFTINTTAGVLGFFDPATPWGLVHHEEDFGQTLGWWGVPPGPYLVLPLFGPSTPRDAFGRIADVVFGVVTLFVDAYILFGVNAVDVVNSRSLVLDEVRTAKEGALDYYVFVRNAYQQRRQALVHDRAEAGEAEIEDLYFYDDDEEDLVEE